MCLILFSYAKNAERPLVVAANRDEFYARPALAAHWWDDVDHIYGGRDLEAEGTWLAVDRTGRFAAVTNWTADLNAPKPPGSRGDLPKDFLAGTMSARAFVAGIDGPHYSGYNLIAFDGDELVYTSNRTDEVRVLDSGVYGMTNERLGATWQKAVNGAAALETIQARASLDDLVDLLTHSHVVAEPKPNGDLKPERSFSPCFIRGDAYGTRASTAIIVADGAIEFVEQHYGPHGVAQGRVSESFPIERS